MGWHSQMERDFGTGAPGVKLEQYASYCITHEEE